MTGVTITESDAAPLSTERLDLATPFVVGETTRGLQTPALIRSMREKVSVLGDRTTETAPLHDWLDSWFGEGGGAVYVNRLLGAAPVAAAHIFVDNAAAAGITVTAIEKGAWANGATGGLSADIDVSGATFNVKIYLDAVLVEESGLVADGAAAAAWAAANSQYVTITDGVGGDPIATGSAANLTAGDDDFDGITQTQIAAALDGFPEDLGPGTIVMPGRTGTTEQLAAAAHGAERNRIVRADLPATETVATLTAQAATLQADDNADRIDMLAPVLTAPGLTSTSVRYVPASVLRCAAESRNDAAGISPNQPAAGEWGIARYVTDATIVWTEDELETLNDAGINVVRVVDGKLRVYGMRTAADPEENPAALSIGSARLRMAVREIARFQSEKAVFAEFDGGGQVLGALKGKISSGIISRYAGSLWSVNAEGDLVEVTAELVAGDTPGTYELEVLVKFRPAGAAEAVNVTISRAYSAS